MITILIAVIFLVALLVCAHANTRLVEIGVPHGRIISQDADRRRPLTRSLVSRRHGLIGKPDYLIETTDGLIPVEVKSRPCPASGPHLADVAQLTAYCILVEENFHTRPSHGVIAYADQYQRVPYTTQHRDRVLGILNEIEAVRNGSTPHRSHFQSGRCRSCGFRAVCDEAL